MQVNPWALSPYTRSKRTGMNARRPEAIDHRGRHSPEAVGPLTLERLAEAARQQRRLGLPILVSGGQPDHPETSLAALMSKALAED